MIYKPDSTRGVEVYVDADFAGGWNPEDASNADNVYSCTGYVICYAGCLIFWQSKLQMEIALSTAEAEYIALSQALREAIPMTNLMREMNVIFPLFLPRPKFVLKVGEKIINHALPCQTIKNSHLKQNILLSNIITFGST